MLERFTKIIAATAFSLSILVPTTQAADLELTAAINQVTVFQSGAEVTRSTTLSLPAGQHRLLFADLPANIDPARLQLTVDSDELSLGNLQLEEVRQSDLVSQEEQGLQAQLDDLLFARQEIVDGIEAARTQLTLLDSLATGAVGGQQAALQANDLDALLATLANSSRNARQVIREANQGLQDLDKDIEQKRFELARVATQQQSHQVLTVAVDASSAVESQLALTYPVYQAGWSWLYEARLDTRTSQLGLARKVSVTQTTGEDWNDVELNITTARQNQNTQTPQLDSLLVDIFRPQPVRKQDTLGAQREASVAEALVTGSSVGDAFNPLQQFANVNASAYIVNFLIPGRVTVTADSQAQILPVDQRGLPVELVTRAVPEQDASAYLEARFIFEEEVPIQSGEMQLYRDGAFIGKRWVPDFLPQEEVSLPFGKDDRVRVETKVVQEQSRDGGIFRRNAIEDHRVRYELTSFHEQPIELEVLARVPVAQNDAIDVEIENDATPFDEENVDGNAGVILWRVQANPGQKIEINHFYAVTFPQDETLNYSGK